ncbi:UNVERIFIED_CONTAM: hypothetical protein RKD50_008280 [Streptomyces canus]
MHDRVAGGERGADLGTGEDQREVERGDRGDHAERLALGVGEGVHGRVPDGAVQGVGEGREVLVVVGRVGHVHGVAQRDRLADVQALQLGEFVGVLADQLGDPVQDPATLATAETGPGAAVEGLPGGADGRVHVGGAGLRDGGDDRTPGRVDHLGACAVGGLTPLAAHKQPSGFDLDGGHRRSSASSPRFQPTGFLLVRSLFTDRFPVNGLA